MSREIKFRAVIKYQYEPMDNFPVTEKHITYFKLKDVVESRFVISDIEELHGCKILEIKYNQYTGLKDKNGKEIYEGDIVKANFDDIKYKEIKEFNSEVMFGYGQFYVCHNSIVYPVFDIFAHVEVIGNIYENPELMEEK